MEKKPTSGMAVAGLVLGIIALVSSFVPLLNLLSFPFVLLSIIFGAIGVWQTVKGSKGGKGLAIAGLVLGILALVVTGVMYASAAVADSAASSTASVAEGAGETVAAVVTEAGIALKPTPRNHAQLTEDLVQTSLQLVSIEELQQLAESMTGVPKPIETTDKVTCIVEYRDGTVIDVIREIKR